MQSVHLSVPSLYGNRRFQKEKQLFDMNSPAVSTLLLSWFLCGRRSGRNRLVCDDGHDCRVVDTLPIHNVWAIGFGEVPLLIVVCVLVEHRLKRLILCHGLIERDCHVFVGAGHKERRVSNVDSTFFVFLFGHFN